MEALWSKDPKMTLIIKFFLVVLKKYVIEDSLHHSIYQESNPFNGSFFSRVNSVILGIFAFLSHKQTSHV